MALFGGASAEWQVVCLTDAMKKSISKQYVVDNGKITSTPRLRHLG